MKNIDSFHRRVPILLEPKNQIDPVMQTWRDMPRLQGLSMYQTKESIILPRAPQWEFNVVGFLAALTDAKFKAFAVLKHLRKEVELWDELLEVGGGFGAREAPCGLDGIEEAVGDVEVVVLVL